MISSVSPYAMYGEGENASTRANDPLVNQIAQASSGISYGKEYGGVDQVLRAYQQGLIKKDELQQIATGGTSFDRNNPQIDYGQGPQSLNPAQQQALSGGKSIQDVSNMIPQNVQQNQAIAQENQDIQSRYKAAAANLPKGLAPAGAAQGIQGVKSIIGEKPAPPVSDGLISSNPYFAETEQASFDYQSPVNQRQSLTQEYQSMLANSGLQALDTEILNVKNILEGTEDDIRNEVTKAGGFATDSQIMALTNARNKQNIKNYNNLLETRNSIEKRLDTMMTLSAKDKEMAMKEFDQKMDFEYKKAQFAQQAQRDARESFQKYADKMGYDKLLDSAMQSGDPTAVSRIERSLGMNSGSLKAIAEVSAQEKQQEAQMLALEVQKRKADIANTYSQISDRAAENAPVSGVPAKVFAKVQASPEYKTINAVLPAMQAIKTYEDAIEQYGTGEVLSGKGKGALESAYGNALVAWKSLAALGALSGADFGLAENAIPQPSLFTRKSVQSSKLATSASNAISQVELMTKRLSQNYPEASTLLNQQLNDIKNIGSSTTLPASEISAMDAILAK